MRLLVLFLLLCLHERRISSSNVVLENNGYKNLIIAINPEIPEDPSLIEAIKNVWTESSQALYVATKQRSYFSDITIVIPKTWSQYNAAQAKKETYDAADVVVAYANPMYQDQPYTLQYGDCGQPATYIHLTPSYLKDPEFVNIFGPKGKAIAHEWAHYRWGVFDETYTYGYSPFYYDSFGRIEATRCPTNLKGVNKIVDFKSENTRDCSRNLENGLPEDGCIFIPYQEQSADLEVSLMSHQYVEQVETFCHNDESDSYNLHNKEAPNEQNRVCNLRSTWEVILDSMDFKNDANSPTNIFNTNPTFHIVRPESSRRFVLVLDTSGSMDGSRLSQMRQVVGIFISQFVPVGDRVSIVEFSTKAHVLSELTSVLSISDRNDLLNLIPTEASGNTCIGCGLELALDVLQRNGEDAAGGNIITFTDGKENEKPTVDDVRNEVLNEGVIVYAIFFATDANTDLQTLVVDTGGIWFYGSDTSIVSILGAFKALAAPSDGDVFNEALQVHSSMFEVDKYSTHTGSVTIDSTVGNNTIFSFAWSQYNIAIGVVIEDPTGCTYSTNPDQPNLCTDYTEPDINIEFEIVTFIIPGTARNGRWAYYVSSSSANSQVVIATVTSQAADRSVEPVVVKSGLKSTKAGTGEAIVVYAQISQGFAPILGASVLANVERPDGSTAQVELFDEGAGFKKFGNEIPEIWFDVNAPDVRKDDGVYSRYFTEYNNPGSYAVQVTVTKYEDATSSLHNLKSSSSRAAANIGTANSNGKVNLNPMAQDYQDVEVMSPNVGNFSRVVTSQGFEYTGIKVTGSTDTFPPNKVIDLKAAQTDVYNSSSGTTLTFTAPGSDFDVGTAASYEIRYVVGNISRLVDLFYTCALVLDSDLLQGKIASPSTAGSFETFVVKPLKLDETRLVTLGFAMRARDMRNNVADTSNVAPVTYFYESPGVAPHQAASTIMTLFGLALAVFCT